ncbi:glycosyltransferase [Sphingobacterium sp. B29]|uniref:glycosyltransferase family 4 protein n=1 Tax=Sphingobacterium sp. B29 TaxID=1933220 RepID=UPI000957E618|nr:glycosyltransferase family 1 protein [Sphingobacterium sp. B29]APU95252.1 glycosyltransferase [Sphingobacterium sp. B29]
MRKTIVISAVNLVEAGPLAILRECLACLSIMAVADNYRVIALVYKQSLADFPNIEYIETQWPKKRWVNRLWYEYVSMRSISRQIGPVSLWFSLHDTSPSIIAERRAVYCHNAFPFYRWKLHDLLFAPKIVLFALFSKYIYRPNIQHNNYLVVQQQWLREAFHRLFAIPTTKIIVAPASVTAKAVSVLEKEEKPGFYSFVFAGSPNSHKNFEVICQAAALLEQQGLVHFKVHLTVKGDENKYAQWLHRKWGHLQSLDFMGFVTREQLEVYYASSDCLIFPSKTESWGLPITEFSAYGKPMLLADLPYAHDTAAGSSSVSFFDPDDPQALATQMGALMGGDESFLHAVAKEKLVEPFVLNWTDLFHKLLQ